MSKFYPLLPFYIMNTSDIGKDEKEIVVGALTDIFSIARVYLPITDFGVWRDPFYKKEGELIPHKSIDWYIDRWYNEERKQINVLYSINELRNDPDNIKNPHYDLILTANDLYARNLNFVIGVAIPTRGAIISLNRYREIKDPNLRIETIKQEVYHEVGHIFCLPNPNSAYVEDKLGWHCINECAMRQGLRVPYDWIRFAEERLRSGEIYCKLCVKELKRYFREGNF